MHNCVSLNVKLCITFENTVINRLQLTSTLFLAILLLFKVVPQNANKDLKGACAWAPRVHYSSALKRNPKQIQWPTWPRKSDKVMVQLLAAATTTSKQPCDAVCHSRLRAAIRSWSVINRLSVVCTCHFQFANLNGVACLFCPFSWLVGDFPRKSADAKSTCCHATELQSGAFVAECQLALWGVIRVASEGLAAAVERSTRMKGGWQLPSTLHR